MRLVKVVTNTRSLRSTRLRISSKQIVDLVARRAHDDRRVHQSGRTNQLLDHRALALAQLIVRRRRRNIDGLIQHRFELGEIQRPVVERRRQTKAIFDQSFLARTVAAIHAADLRHGDVAFIDEEQKIARKITEQCRRRLARFGARSNGANSFRCRDKSPSLPIIPNRKACAVPAAALRAACADRAALPDAL